MSISGFDFFDDELGDDTSRPDAVLRDAKPGDIVSVGRTKWSILRSLGDFQAYATKHPSKGKKLYMIQSEGLGDPNSVVVFQVGGSGQRVSKDIAAGVVSRATKQNRSGGRIRRMFVGGYIQHEVFSETLSPSRWTRIAEVVVANDVDTAIDLAVRKVAGGELSDEDNAWIHVVVSLEDGIPVLYSENENVRDPVCSGDHLADVTLDLLDGDAFVVRVMASGYGLDSEARAEDMARELVSRSIEAAEAQGVPPEEIAGFYSAVIQYDTGVIRIITG